MKDDHIAIKPSVLYFGTPVVLLVTRNPEGTANITPISSAWALGSNVVIGLGAANQGTANLLRQGECSLNFPSADLWPRVERKSKTTGRRPVPRHKADVGYEFAGDKFALGGFTAQASDLVGTPRIAECPLQFEASPAACHGGASPHRDAGGGHFVIELHVLRVHAAQEMVFPGTNRVDTSRWNPLFYVFRHYFGNALDLGRNFRAES